MTGAGLPPLPTAERRPRSRSAAAPGRWRRRRRAVRGAGSTGSPGSPPEQTGPPAEGWRSEEVLAPLREHTHSRTGSVHGRKRERRFSPAELKVFAACQPNSREGSRGWSDWKTGLALICALTPHVPGRGGGGRSYLQQVVQRDVRGRAGAQGPAGEQRRLQFGVGRQRHLEDLGVHRPLRLA